MKTLYFDCAKGISGNMAIGALLEVSDGEQYLRSELNKLGVSGYDVSIVKRGSHGIDGTYVEGLEAGTDIPVDVLPEEIYMEVFIITKGSITMDMVTHFIPSVKMRRLRKNQKKRRS